MLPHIFSAESRTFCGIPRKFLPIAEEIDILSNSSGTFVTKEDVFAEKVYQIETEINESFTV